jgi:hypothetical protein
MESDVLFAAKIHAVDGWITTSCRSPIDAHKHAASWRWRRYIPTKPDYNPEHTIVKWKKVGIDWLLETEAVRLNDITNPVPASQKTACLLQRPPNFLYLSNRCLPWESYVTHTYIV